jgi:RNA recognition motif-containing protein
MNIYVGNMSHQTTEDELRQAFAAFGDVLSVKFIRDKATGESRGFGFVEMSSEQQALAAIEAMNGKDFMGQVLKVEKGQTKPARFTRTGPDKSGRFDRDRGGRDRGSRDRGRDSGRDRRPRY